MVQEAPSVGLANKPDLGDKFVREITGHLSILPLVSAPNPQSVLAMNLWISVSVSAISPNPQSVLAMNVISWTNLSLLCWLIPAQSGLKLAYWPTY